VTTHLFIYLYRGIEFEVGREIEWGFKWQRRTEHTNHVRQREKAVKTVYTQALLLSRPSRKTMFPFDRLLPGNGISRGVVARVQACSS
jgi:hypothetical protein